jgi:hypothetical protein
MSFNSTDFTKTPWVDGCMSLNDEECNFVLTACDKIKADNPLQQYDDSFIIGQYNLIDWKKSINGDTYYQGLKGYREAGHNLGINENGIIAPEVPEEEAPPVEPEAPAEEETPTEETTTTEDTESPAE